MSTELLQPQARQVDTYVQPARPALADFADALAKIDRPLRQFMDRRAEKQAEEDRIRGEAAFYDDNSGDIAEAVRSGKLPAHYSPAFVKGFKNSQGNVAGNKLRSTFNAAFDAWDGKNSDDPEAYDRFVADFLASNINSEDPEVLRGLMPHIKEIDANGQARYTEYRHQQTYQGSLDAAVAGANQDIEELNREGLSTEEGTNYPVVFKKIEEKRAAFVASGGKPEDFDKTMVDAMSAKVLATRDPGLLAWFDQKVPGKDYTYGESPYGAKVKLETEASLEVIARRNFTEDAAKQKALEEKRKDDAHRQAIELLSENPGAPIPDGVLKLGEVDPTFKVRIEEWRSALGRGFSDPAKIRDVYADILSGKGAKAVQEAFSAGVFGRIEDVREAYAFAKSYEDNKDRITAALTNPAAENILKMLDVRTKGISDMSGEPISGMSNEGFEATYDFRRMVQDWVIKNPDASAQELEDAVSKIGKDLMDRIELPNAMEFNSGTYSRPEDLGFDNPFTDGTGVPEVEEPSAEPEADPMGDKQGEAQDLLDGLQAPQRQAMEERAKAMGLTPEQFVDQFVLQDPASASPINYTPGGGAEAQNAALTAAPGRGLAALVSSDKRGYSPDLENLRPEIVSGVEDLQTAWGRSLPIVSGFRGAARNKKAGGAKKSQHKHGNAVDIDVSDLSKAERVNLIRMASEKGFTGIGVYATSLHLDKGGRRAWGPSYGKESLPGWAKAAIGEHMGRQDVARAKDGPRGFDSKTALAFLDDALEGNPLDTEYEGSAQLPDGDQQAARILNFIGGHEAAGNYNAIAGNAGNARDLSKLTLNQILATQVVARRRGVESTAVGKYQIVYETLSGLKRELKLSGNEPFNRKLQDRLGLALLNRRGYQLYKAGRLSKRQFALRLSQEWAALPNPRTGRSYYAGVGRNRSSARAAEVYAALGV
ncbi:D-Ala-D-Ala carboxypeptidase family metallohydrolase [Aminobacter sp. HY435]|uniref:D-Ala-D-Ala carboxypeptidase family metallohydrolase n=1 Tax=Aminobacter sp. HY435 TaxID=2970917 RepID=UPI0022B98D64|nr:D-Ala-D-Ala carboxypeptidase family metallohydrolase [Aminobacter sp. HY435]